MNLKTQKRIASEVLGCSPKKVFFDTSAEEDIKSAVTRGDIRNLIGSDIIKKSGKNQSSRVRVRKLKSQKAKGRRKNSGSRKGTLGARLPSKGAWMKKVRLLREFIKQLRDKELITKETYHDLYSKVSGGYFRNKRHIKLYLEESDKFIEKS
ncbi:MAG: 50S ribosomal protein L19e [Nanobdellota archaeon]